MLKYHICVPVTPALIAGMDGVFVGSGIFKSGNPEQRARAIVQAVTHYKDAKLLAEVKTNGFFTR